MEKSKSRDFRDLDIEIKGIMKTYLSYVYAERQQTTSFRLSDSEVDSNAAFERNKRLKYINAVNTAVSSLDGLEQHLIKCEFIELIDVRNWWVGIISRSHFYRIKRDSMQKFLKMFLSILYDNPNFGGGDEVA